MCRQWLFVGLLGITALILYSDFTSTVFFVSIESPMFYWIPLEYWTAVVATLGISGYVLLSSKSSNFDYLVLFMLQAALFIAPQFMLPSARVNDTYDFEYLVNYITQPSLYNQTSYPLHNYLVNWPGFFTLVASLQSVTGVSHNIMIRLILIIGQVTILLLSISLGRLLFKSLKGGVLTGFVTVALGWDVWSTGSPVLLGSVFLILSVVILATTARRQTRLLLLSIVFAATTITHGLTPVVLLPVLGSTYLVDLFLPNLSKVADVSPGSKIPMSRAMFSEVALRVDNYALLVGITIFGVWILLQPSAINIANLLTEFRFIFKAGTTPLTYQLGYLTSFRFDVLLLAAIYLLVLVVWTVATFSLALKFKLPIGLKPIVAVIVGATVLYLFAPIRENFYDRFFQNMFPFLALFLVTVMIRLRGKWKILSVSFMVLLLVLGFLVYYSNESVQAYPRSETLGDLYLVTYSPSQALVADFTPGPYPESLANAPSVINGFSLTPDAGVLVLGLNQSSIIVNSKLVLNGLSYYIGSASILERYIALSSLNKVYSSAAYDIYTKVIPVAN